MRERKLAWQNQPSHLQSINDKALSKDSFLIIYLWIWKEFIKFPCGADADGTSLFTNESFVWSGDESGGVAIIGTLILAKLADRFPRKNLLFIYLFCLWTWIFCFSFIGDHLATFSRFLYWRIGMGGLRCDVHSDFK